MIASFILESFKEYSGALPYRYTKIGVEGIEILGPHGNAPDAWMDWIDYNSLENGHFMEVRDLSTMLKGYI